MSTNIPVAGKALGKYSARISIEKDGFFVITQESPGSGDIILHFSSVKCFVKDVLLAAKQAEAAYKLQPK